MVTIVYFIVGYLVIKSIAYFPSQIARNAKEPLEAFLWSCRQNNIRIVENSLDADAAVIWSVLWSGRMAPNQAVYKHYRDHARPVVVMDVGALYRGTTWKIAVNNINAHGYYGHTQDLDWDRPTKLRLSMGYTMAGSPAVLIAAQHRHSLQVEDLVSIEHWIQDQIEMIRKHSDRPIVIRPHPRCQLDHKALPKDVEIEIPQHIYNTYDGFNLRFDYQAMINYNSGPGIQSAIEGCPVIVDSSSLAHPVSIGYQDIDSRPQIDRDRWFVEITHTEYTKEEIAQATWLKRIRTALL